MAALLAILDLAAAAEPGLFARDNLVAWCIVPFDAKQRGPEERAAMLQRLGFRRFAYDWRAEHLPTFDAEIAALRRAGIELTAVWFPGELNADAQLLLATLEKHRIRTQLWVMRGDDGPANSPAEQRRKVVAHAGALRPVAEAAAKLGCSVALYNHGGWFGEPENQLAIIDELNLPNVGIVYNLHHGHEHLPRLGGLLPRMAPRLLAFNLNGMVSGGDRTGQKIWVLGQGREDLALLKMLSESGWRGPVGILGHTQDDAEDRLRDNLDGLDWILPQLDGAPPGPLPMSRTAPRPAGLGTAAPQPANLTPADPAFRATLIDRSPDEAYLAVKVDDAGRVFVGGREKVFRFDPDGHSFHRRELLRLPPDSIVIGLEFRGDDLYVLAAHGLYLVPGGRIQAENLEPRRILWGVPLDYHVSFHCLAWGPEGDLYLNHGDPLLGHGPDHHGHWTLYAGPRAEPFSYTGAGAVLRVRPDGSSARVVATGLRGPVGLAFDRLWNLFTNDNDHESLPDQFAPARLLHVTQGADFGWPNGWMARKSPERADLRDCLHGALGRGVPCDLVNFDEPSGGAARGELLMCRWDRFAVTRYALTRSGASFRAAEQVFAQGSDNARPTGIAVDAQGRLFVTCLYLTGNVVTPKCPSDLTVIELADRPVAAAAESAASVAAAGTNTLWQALQSKSWETRRRAHQEILRRGPEFAAGAVARLEALHDEDLAAPHLPWLAAAAGPQASSALLRRARESNSPLVREQAIRALAAFPQLAPPASLFIDALRGEPADGAEAALQLTALAWFLENNAIPPIEAVASLAASDDEVLRQTAATLLARRASLAALVELVESANPARRLAGVLAAGIRLTSPPATSGPPDGVKLHEATDTAFFSTKIQFADAPAPIALASLAPLGTYTSAERWSAAPRSADEERLFELLRTVLERFPEDASEQAERVRLQAAYYLGLLRDPRTEPTIAAVRFAARARGLLELEPKLAARAWRIGPFVSLPPGEHVIERGPIDLSAAHPTGSQSPASTDAPRALLWQEIAAADDGIPAPGAGTWFALLRVRSRERQRALLHLMGASAEGVRHNGRVAPAEGGGYLLDLQPGGNELLIRASVDRPIGLAIRARHDVAWDLPERSDGAEFAERLRRADRGAAPAEFLNIDWSVAGRQGDVQNGRRLFGALGCAKCHAVTANQAGGGAPSLADAGKRFSPNHVVESVLLPDRQVAAEFRATRIAAGDGLVLVGLVVRESDSELELLLPDASRRVIATSDIEARSLSPNSPMPSGLVKTAAELRDLISYLLSENPAAP